MRRHYRYPIPKVCLLDRYHHFVAMKKYVSIGLASAHCPDG